MANSHKISGSALIALKEALTNIYWIKNDLKMFVNHTINNKSFHYCPVKAGKSVFEIVET